MLPPSRSRGAHGDVAAMSYKSSSLSTTACHTRSYLIHRLFLLLGRPGDDYLRRKLGSLQPLQLLPDRDGHMRHSGEVHFWHHPCSHFPLLSSKAVATFRAFFIFGAEGRHLKACCCGTCSETFGGLQAVCMRPTFTSQIIAADLRTTVCMFFTVYRSW